MIYHPLYWVLLALVCLLSYATGTDSTFKLEMKATWADTSKIAEVAEFLSHRTNESLYWAFIERLDEIKDENGLGVAKTLLDGVTFSLLEMSLDTRYYSPRVQYQITKSTRQETSVQDARDDGIVDVDVSYGTPQNGSYTLINADFSDAEDRALVSRVVKQKKNAGETVLVRYINKRQLPADPNKYMQHDSKHQAQLLNVHGYGVELQLKNMEYKQTDSESQSSSFGIDFDVLKKRLPHLSTDLDTFRDHLQREAPKRGKAKEIKVWDMKNFGLQAAHLILNDRSNSLDQLESLSQNFPAHISSLINIKTSDDFKSKISNFQNAHQELLEARNPSNPQETIRRNAIYVNGIETDLTKLSLFSLYDLVAKETQFIEKFSSYGLSGDVVQKLLFLPSSKSDERPRFRIPKEYQQHIAYLNDIEKDDRYRYNFPEQLITMTQPNFFNQMRFVRRNLYTIIIIFDPLNHDHIKKIQELSNPIDRGYPIRVGLLPKPNDTEESIELISRFEHLYAIKGTFAALKYLYELPPNPDLHTIKNNYNNYRGSDKAIDVGNPEKIKMKRLQKLINSEMGFEHLGFFLLMNGALFEGDDESGDQLFMNALRYEYERAIELIRKELISDGDHDLLDAIISQNSNYDRYNENIFGQGHFVHITKIPDHVKWITSSSSSPDEIFKNTHLLCHGDSDELISSAKKFVNEIESTRIGLQPSGSSFCKNQFSDGIGIIATSGRSIDLSTTLEFSAKDWQLLTRFEKSSSFDLISNYKFEHENAIEISNVIFYVNSILSTQTANGDRIELSRLNNPITTLTFNDANVQLPKITAVIDPLSLQCQRYSTIIKWLVNYGFPFILHLNPELETSNMPLKSYYRYVLLQNSADFENITTNNGEIYTLRMDVPETWLVEPIYAKQDLDNLNLHSDCKSNVCYARYQLEYLVATGSCYDTTLKRSPRGLQLSLVDEFENKVKDITIVMANLGYFQLKAQPGLFNVVIPQGRHSEIYSLSGVSQQSFYQQSLDNKKSSRAVVHVNDFDAPFLRVDVVRNEGKYNEELLTDSDVSQEQAAGGLWNSVFGGGSKKVEEASGSANKTIHIFSLASGHMYERLLKIMILSVMKHLKRPNVNIKFWFLGQFLSPGFKTMLPHLSSHFGFQYGLVSYQWPDWLHKQKEKQRLIWAYKVLFLDVLFPLNQVNKIIFVDADQICRSDMSELFFDLDMQGKSLAYTPFCESRTEMAGFQFWKQGYWSQHLRGLPYHISALYVVDVAKFRKEYHGDQFRMYYDNLARDPNSLSNLDQDLPNYAQHVVPIRSLPQEWLWCETWCSDESKPKAKTIDLCNNPQTKEHKLASARRIIPEWTSYDEEIKAYEKTLGSVEN
ncbi:UDP-glucose:glycoprotein glucosyltransferase [Acrasis kona]|uniref:UDP-glucose:glycoprotein glucosyltransferase n=1 Tax=Acrasis kona TaxID=1008807 RepID=A0AAW2ZI39_9EUKA